jgi:hypothetical protein
LIHLGVDLSADAGDVEIVVAVAGLELHARDGSADQIAAFIFEPRAVNLDVIQIVAIGIMQFEDFRRLVRRRHHLRILLGEESVVGNKRGVF